MSISKTAYYYKPKKRIGDEAIKIYLQALANVHKRWGFDKMMLKIKMDKQPWNHKRVYRIYCEIGLNIRVKPRKRIPKGEAKVINQPITSNVCWSIDFMSDVLSTGQKFRTINAVDDYNRECLLIEPSYSLPSSRVTELLDTVAAKRGYPEMIRVDNGLHY
jgi:putative transposase